MQVIVRMSAPLSDTIGQKRLTVELQGHNHTVADVVAALESRHPGFREKLRGDDERLGLPYNLVLNESVVRLERAAMTEVLDGDTLFIFMPVAGGQRP